MKRLLIFLTGLLLWSCERGKVADPPYVSEWYVINQTGCDIRFYIERVYVEDKEEKTAHDCFLLAQGAEFYQSFLYDNKETQEFVRLFLFLHADELLSCRVYLTPVDSDEILKEWVWGKDNGEHDFFDESEWKHNSWEDTTTTYYTIYHNEWTFTITDADIGLSPKSF